MADVKFNIASNAYQGAAKMGGLPTPELSGPKGAGGATSFSDLVSEAAGQAKSVGYNTEIKSLESVANKTELHELVTAVSSAELTLHTVVAVRDRVVQAYQEILKMPI